MFDRGVHDPRSSRLASIRAADDPGRSLPRHEAQAARDERLQALRAAKAERETARAELARRESEKQSLWGRMWATEAQNKRRKENTPTDFEAERVEFHAGLKADQDKKNAAELQRRREAGLLYEPTGDGGGDAVAGLFSSSVVWDFTEVKIQKDGIVGQILTARHIVTLWWAANLIAEHGGECVSYPQDRPPHWPDQGGEITYRDSDLSHLAANKLLEIERGIGSGSLVTLRFGTRTKDIVAGYRESIGKKAA